MARWSAFFRERLRVSGRGGKDLNRVLVADLARRRIPSRRQFKYLGQVLTPAERNGLGISVLVLVLSFLVIGWRLWSARVVSVPAVGGEYAEAVLGAPSLPNPLFAVGSDVDADLVRLMYAGLMIRTPEGELRPDLAESYDVSSDGKQYTFRLREDLRWHDGAPLTVDDVLFTLSLIQNPEYKSPLSRLFRSVTSERLDERTVRFLLAEPTTSFLSNMTVGILPTHIWQDVPPSGATLAEYNLKPVGAGPFRFKSLIRDKSGSIRSYTMERFAETPNPARLERITMRFYPDMESAITAVAAKQADAIAFVPTQFRSKVEARPDLSRYPLKLPQYTAVFFNAKNQPLFKEEPVRKALIAATPQEKILADVLRGDGELVGGPLPPGVIGYDAALTQAAFDPGKAIELLEGAGYKLPNATSSIREKTKSGVLTSLDFKLTTIDRPEYVAAAEILQSAWREVGIEVDIATVPSSAIARDVLRNHDYEALLFAEVMGGDQDPYPFWHSSQTGEGGFNLALYANRGVDELLIVGRAATSTDLRAKTYKDFAKKVVADAPAVFLYRPAYPYYISRSVKGVRAESLSFPSDRFASVREWYTKTRRALR